MKLIYKARDITEAHIISGLLASNDIVAHVGGYYLQGGVGDLAAMDFATINVADEDVDAAVSIITEYEKTNLETDKIDDESKSSFSAPLIVLAVSVIMMLLLAVAFSDYQ